MISVLNECERIMDVEIIKQILQLSIIFINESNEKLIKVIKVHSV